MFGVIFYLFNVDLREINDESKNINSNTNFNDIKLGLINTSESIHHNHMNSNELMTNMRHDHDNNFLTQFMPGL